MRRSTRTEEKNLNACWDAMRRPPVRYSVVVTIIMSINPTMDTEAETETETETEVKTEIETETDTEVKTIKKASIPNFSRFKTTDKLRHKDHQCTVNKRS